MSTEKIRPVDLTTPPTYNEAEKGLASPTFQQALPTLAKYDQKAAQKPAQKPKKRVSRWIRWRIWFNTYRKFFTFVFLFNLTGIALAISGHFPYAVANSGSIVVGNLNFAILMRNECFGRLLYLIVNTLFAKVCALYELTSVWACSLVVVDPALVASGLHLGTSGKPGIRPGVISTQLRQHLGGIHSGCALSGVLWLMFKVVNAFLHMDVEHDAILAMGVVTNIAVIISALSAFPWVRNTHHNVFERHHRFIGWFGLLCTWVFVILGDAYDPVTRSWNAAGVKLIRHQDFWYTCSMTFFILLPWLCLREVPVEVELPSSKVAIIRFERGMQRLMQQGLLGRISRSSVLEFHTFGIVSEGRHAKYHYMVAGVQGDFTKELVNNPPKTLWTRELKLAGVSNTSTLYRRGIRICTGTGIGAALSTCLQSPDWYLIWIGSDQEKTFGPTINGLIKKHLEGRTTLWDSKQRGGRPDTMKLLKEIYHSWGAEVVFITSNYVGNSEMMEGCKAAGIPAFGTLWDF
ncbi:Urb2 domain-containing protein [Mycena chlorophos]|uniref:Urb2 domain-containing protein n=1 Tax=Mycena chlorophos TaxID=658473 RepID=A0A8H6TU57_MYCCL|nr:Urb2 domain-containing protein [Mycena chlorophos]